MPVHCELVLAERFAAQGLDFFAARKYIGCSKPACYMCYKYLTTHEANFEHPATSEGIWPYPLPPGA